MFKERIIKDYGLVGSSISVEISYQFYDDVSTVTGEGAVPLQISNNDGFKIFRLVQKVDKSVSIFVTFKEVVDGKIIFLRPKQCLTAVGGINNMRDGITSADVVGDMDVVTGNKVDTELLNDDIIMRHVKEI